MKSLVVEDDFTSRLLLQEILKEFGTVHVAVNGLEALKAVKKELNWGEPYDLICLDVMMPELDGQETLKKIRDLEKEKGIFSTQGSKILMTTALDDSKSIKNAFYNLCDGYLVKPIDKEKFQGELLKLKVL
ncbi:MAG: response regulator [Spirochaetaceae bacterium]|jgi:two-component system chemotaxis response regulator CheY|nr:response regulator [Spirochaetaceae bacterium]